MTTVINSGTVDLTSGTATVSVPDLLSTDQIMLSVNTPGGGAIHMTATYAAPSAMVVPSSTGTDGTFCIMAYNGNYGETGNIDTANAATINWTLVRS